MAERLVAWSTCPRMVTLPVGAPSSRASFDGGLFHLEIGDGSALAWQAARLADDRNAVGQDTIRDSAETA
jgi:hypothetical protein